MKKTICFLIALLATKAFPQDVIVKKDGTTILSKVIEITDYSKVKYKKWTNQEGPLYTIAIDDILSINYENGEKEDFGNTLQNASSKQGNVSNMAKPREIIREVSPENAALIAQYNEDCGYTKSSSSKAPYVLYFWNVAENSVLRNEDIEIEFQPSIKGYLALKVYNVVIKNHTERPIYIDRANTFNNNTMAWDNTMHSSSYSSSEGGGTGIGFSILGIGIGGSSSSSTGSASTTSTRQERIANIAPHGSLEIFTFSINRDNYSFIALKVGEEHKYTTENTPSLRKYFITYSKDENFSEYSTIQATVYIAKAIGAKKMKHKNYLSTFSYDFPYYYVPEKEAKKYLTNYHSHLLWRDVKYKK